MQMFDCIKNKFKKKNSNDRCSSVASAFLVDPEKYMKSVEDEILSHWVDIELQEKLGVSNLFTDNVCVKNINMSYDDACDCLKRIDRMVDMSTYVVEQFCERANALPRENMKAVDNSNFFTANTICNLFEEAKLQNFVDEESDDAPETVQDAIELINESLNYFPTAKRNVFFIAVTTAQTVLCTMRGFVEE
jgi:hypothetical protein